MCAVWWSRVTRAAVCDMWIHDSPVLDLDALELELELELLVPAKVLLVNLRIKCPLWTFIDSVTA